MNVRRAHATLLGFVFFLLCFAAAAIVQAPAALLDAVVAYHTQQRLRLVDCAGTIWRGRALLTTASGHARAGIEWRIAARSLLRATLSSTVRIDAGAPVPIQASRRRLEIGALDAALPAALVAEALGAHSSYGIGGNVRVRTAGLVIGTTSGSGTVEIEWRQAQTGIIDLSPLGSYRARVDLSAAGGRTELQTLEGPLMLSGSGVWTQGGFAGSLVARGSGPHADRISAWLATSAPAQPDGSFRFVWPAPQRAGARS